MRDCKSAGRDKGTKGRRDKGRVRREPSESALFTLSLCPSVPLSLSPFVPRLELPMN
jgi:hypothetical protein